MVKPPKTPSRRQVAAVSLSWGGPSRFPQRYQTGVRQLQQELVLPYGVRAEMD